MNLTELEKRASRIDNAGHSDGEGRLARISLGMIAELREQRKLIDSLRAAVQCEGEAKDGRIVELQRMVEEQASRIAELEADRDRIAGEFNREHSTAQTRIAGLKKQLEDASQADSIVKLARRELAEHRAKLEASEKTSAERKAYIFELENMWSAIVKWLGGGPRNPEGTIDAVEKLANRARALEAELARVKGVHDALLTWRQRYASSVACSACGSDRNVENGKLGVCPNLDCKTPAIDCNSESHQRYLRAELDRVTTRHTNLSADYYAVARAICNISVSGADLVDQARGVRAERDALVEQRDRLLDDIDGLRGRTPPAVTSLMTREEADRLAHEWFERYCTDHAITAKGSLADLLMRAAGQS